MDTKELLSSDQAEILAKELLDREPRVRDSWLGRWARGWEARRGTCETSGLEFNPLVHPGNPRWSAYNSIFDNWHK